MKGIMPAEYLGDVDYSRLDNTAFPKRRMEALTAAVVGLGALGNEVVKALGLIGTGTVLAIDPERIEASNLTRSVFYSYYSSVGRNKAETIAEVCGKLFPNTRFDAFPVEVADVGFQDLQTADLIFSCVDSELARLEIAYASTRLDIPVADAGLGADDYSQGRVTWFGGRRAPCYSCLLSRRARREILSLSDVPVRSCWALESGGSEGIPGTPMMAAIVGAMQVEFGLRALLEGRRDEGFTTELAVGPVPQLDRFTLHVSNSCPFHERSHVLVAAPQDHSTTVWDLLESVEGSDPVLVLDWPVCTSASCADCGHKWAPRERLAAFRRRTSCPACRSANVREEETIRSITRHSSWASTTLADLGLPSRHLYTVRTGDTQ